MTNLNKLNYKQKEMMGEFMQQHPNLAKNIIPNCAQGKATSQRLWEDLSKKLNAVGPPMKDAKMWRKVYADQKYQAKRKLTFNRSSKSRTGGGPYEEKLITSAEENIIEASGLEATVEGLQTVQTWGNISKGFSQHLFESPIEVSKDFDEIEFLQAEMPSVEIDTNNPTTSTRKIKVSDYDIEEYNVPSTSKRRRKVCEDPKLTLLEQNLKSANEAKLNMDDKLGRLVDIQERMLQIQERTLQIREEKHKRFCALNDLEIELRKRDLNPFSDSE
ncbi:uncharacterized protein [Eurosta solidaginis]|uniref:uncharacterized protein n=2 Tax=Eurosta solidaginis TaxID=178769 RepID=UPI003530BFFE